MVERASSWSVVERLFEQHNVPLAVIEQPQHRIPLAAMIGLFESAGEIVGDRAFGLRVGLQMKHQSYGIWARYIASASSLAEAIKRSSETIHFHQTGARISFAATGQHTIWRYHRAAGYAGCDMHHSDHVLPSMIDLARLYLGAAWNPDWVELSYANSLHSSKVADLLQADVKFGQPSIGIAVPSDSLPARPRSKLPIEKVVTLGELVAHSQLRSNDGFVGMMRDVVALRLLEGQTDLDGAARLVGMGPRTLQRMLNAEGMNYKDIVRFARHERALFLLRNTKAGVGEIAVSLGYEDFANFTRAFRQWTGVPPSAVRSRPDR